MPILDLIQNRVLQNFGDAQATLGPTQPASQSGQTQRNGSSNSPGNEFPIDPILLGEGGMAISPPRYTVPSTPVGSRRRRREESLTPMQRKKRMRVIVTEVAESYELCHGDAQKLEEFSSVRLSILYII